MDPGARVLDVGSGTGVVLKVLSRSATAAAAAVGVDISPGMLKVASAGAAGLQAAVADACRLPFPSRSFDVVTMSFVLSHLSDYSAGLSETSRVLVPGGTVAVSNWGPSVHPAEQLWDDLLEEVVGASAERRAKAEVAPWESHFARPGHLRSALEEVGIQDVDVRSREFFVRARAEEFLADRELSARARLARRLLSDGEWARFRKRVISRLRARFGPHVAFGRQVHVAVGSRAHDG